MRKCAQELGGEHLIRSEPDVGTTVIVSVPLPREELKNAPTAKFSVIPT